MLEQLLKTHLKDRDEERDTLKLKDIERQAILEALYYTNWHVTLAAKRLGISRASVYRKIKLYDIKQIPYTEDARRELMGN